MFQDCSCLIILYSLTLQYTHEVINILTNVFVNYPCAQYLYETYVATFIESSSYMVYAFDT